MKKMKLLFALLLTALGGLSTSYAGTPAAKGGDDGGAGILTSVGYARIQGLGNLNTSYQGQPKADLVTINFTYKFD